jgi:hypothetical protein
MRFMLVFLFVLLCFVCEVAESFFRKQLPGNMTGRPAQMLAPRTKEIRLRWEILKLKRFSPS